MGSAGGETADGWQLSARTVVGTPRNRYGLLRAALRAIDESSFGVHSSGASRRSRFLLLFGRRGSRCRSRSNGPNRSSRPSRSDRPNRPDRASSCSLAEFCRASYERGTSEHPELIFHRRLRSAVDMTTDTTRTLAECEGCGFPYVVRRTNEGSSYPVGVNECSQCGGTTFTTVDGDALGTGVSPRSGES